MSTSMSMSMSMGMRMSMSMSMRMRMSVSMRLSTLRCICNLPHKHPTGYRIHGFWVVGSDWGV